MRKKRFLLPLLVILVVWAVPAPAQRGGRVSIAADIGVIFPHLSHPEARHFNTEADLVFGGHFDYGISDHAGLQFGLLRSDQEVETAASQTNTMTIQELYALFRWNLWVASLQPFFTLGLNYSLINLDPPLEDESDPGFVVGVGLDAILTDNISLGVTGRYNYLFTQGFDSVRIVNCLLTLAFAF